MSDVTNSLGNQIFITIVMPIVTFIGVSSNVAFLFVLSRVKEMQNVTSFYLANLAIADVSYLMTVTVCHMWRYFAFSPIQNSGLSNVPWKSLLGCYLPYIMIYTSYFASVFFIALVSIERYFSICHALRHRSMNSKKRAAALVFGAWFLAFVFTTFFMTPVSITQLCYALPDGQTLISTYNCIWFCDSCITTIVIIDIIQYAFALTTTSVLYTLIVLQVVNRNIGQRNTTSSMKYVVMRMVITTTVIFFICLFPFQIINIQEVILRLGGGWFMSLQTFSLLVGISGVTSLVNAALNPIVYSLTNSTYRKAFFNTFRLKPKEQDTNDVPQSKVNARRGAIISR